MIIGDFLHSTIKFEGLIDKILEQAVKSGLAKTKVEALRLGVIELEHKHNLLKQLREEEEDRSDLASVRKMNKLIRQGKMKLYTEKELKQALKGRWHGSRSHPDQ